MILAWIDGFVQRVTEHGRFTHQMLVGECGRASKELSKAFGLRAIPGWAVFEGGGRAEHVWCEDSKGAVYDATQAQFSVGIARYVPWKPGDVVRTGRCMNCGDDIYKPVESLDSRRHDYACGPECIRELERDLNA